MLRSVLKHTIRKETAIVWWGCGIVLPVLFYQLWDPFVCSGNELKQMSPDLSKRSGIEQLGFLQSKFISCHNLKFVQPP